MAAAKYILEQIKIEGAMQDLITKSDGENVKVVYDGTTQTLSEALTAIFTAVSALPSTADVNSAVSTAINNLIDGAPETYDTLKEIATYLEGHATEYQALQQLVATKVTAVNGKGLSTEDFTTAFKNKLTALPDISATDVENWNNKAPNAEATQSQKGLMSASDKKRVDEVGGVWFGETAPEGMRNGDLFIKVVSQA